MGVPPSMKGVTAASVAVSGDVSSTDLHGDKEDNESTESPAQPVPAVKKPGRRRGPRHGSMMGVPPSMSAATAVHTTGADDSGPPQSNEVEEIPEDSTVDSPAQPVPVVKKPGRRRGPRHGSMMGVPPST
eukprot:10513269-Ditylum_brightwellii.AAC.1